ncbi:MFS transporter [Pseudoteredinibacter isoporae]|uniref:MFS transporter n=1 Tax=Pseudoteredinibacter isoporae TaxID=570281 RepID=UPI00310848FB
MNPTRAGREAIHPGVAGTICALVGYSVIFLLPSFVEAAAQHYALNDQQLGWLGAADTAGLALSTTVMAISLQRFKLPQLLMAGVVIAVSANVYSLLAGNLGHLLGSRFFAGLGEGLLVVVGMSTLAQTRDTNRWFAIYTAAAVVLQAIGLFVLPRIIELWGFDGVIVCFLILLLSPLLFRADIVPLVSNEQPVSVPHTVSRFSSLPLYSALLAVLGFYISIGTFWTYAATLGTAQGFSFDSVSEALSLSMIGGFAGALLLMFLGTAAKNYRIYLISALVMVASLLALRSGFTQFLYLGALIAYSVVWSVIASKLYADVAEGDGSGRFITACQPLINIGFALGPLLASQWVLVHGNQVVIYVAVMALLVSMVCIYPLVHFLGKRRRTEALEVTH